MNDDEFWKLIGLIDQSALDSDDEEGAVAPVERALSAKTEPELVQFAETLALKLYALDGEIYFQNCGEAAQSDDSFLYARCYVVAKGKRHYEETLADPTKMPKRIDQWCESLLYVHMYAWEQLTGRSASEWPHKTSVSYESASNPELWKT